MNGQRGCQDGRRVPKVKRRCPRRMTRSSGQCQLPFEGVDKSPAGTYRPLADRLLADTGETVEFDDMLAGLDVKGAGWATAAPRARGTEEGEG